MLPKKYRIETGILPEIFKKNRVFSSSFLVLRVNTDNEKTINNFRLAVIVPVKVIKNSVDRHLIKRRIHNFFQKNINLIKNNINLVLQIKKNPLTLEISDLEKELTFLLNESETFNKII